MPNRKIFLHVNLHRMPVQIFVELHAKNQKKKYFYLAKKNLNENLQFQNMWLCYNYSATTCTIFFFNKYVIITYLFIFVQSFIKKKIKHFLFFSLSQNFALGNSFKWHYQTCERRNNKWNPSSSNSFAHL